MAVRRVPPGASVGSSTRRPQPDRRRLDGNSALEPLLSVQCDIVFRPRRARNPRAAPFANAFRKWYTRPLCHCHKRRITWEINMRYLHRIIIIGLLCGYGTLTRAAGGDWTTIYGSVREEARQVSSSSLAVPLSPAQCSMASWRSSSAHAPSGIRPSGDNKDGISTTWRAL